MKIKVETNKAPQAIGPYSQAIVAGNMVFTAGQIHLTVEGKLLEGTIEEEAHQVMKNLQVVLEAAGASFQDVVKTTVYLTDLTVFKQVNEVYTQYVTEPFPVRETVGVGSLPMGSRLEISMVAIKDQK